jgi:hypothetical protein
LIKIPKIQLTRGIAIKLNTKEIYFKRAISSNQVIFVLIVFLASYFVGIHNINLFELSQDFLNNKFMIAQHEYALTKGFFYYFYSVFFFRLLTEDQYLVLIWSFVPAGAAATLFIILNEIAKFQSILGLFSLFLMQISVFYFFVLKWPSQDLMFPTGHLLFQSASSSIALIAILFRYRSKYAYYLLGFFAVNLHYSAALYFAISWGNKLINKGSVLISNYKVSRLALKKLIFSLILSLFFSYLLLFLADKIRGYGKDDMLGVDKALIASIYMSASITFIALILSKAYLGRGQNNDQFKSGFYLLIKSLFAISLISIIMTTFHYGLAYRLNYIIYVASPIILFVIIFMLVKISVRKMRCYTQKIPSAKS